MVMMANVSFVLLKINDFDVGGPLRQQQSEQQRKEQETALKLLLSEETENIVLQLKRKSDTWTHMTRSGEDCAGDGIEVSKRLCHLKIHRSPVNSVVQSSAPDASCGLGQEIIMSLHLPGADAMSISTSTQTDDMAYYVHEQLRNIQKDTERLIEEEHNLFEQSLAPEIDIEEITLRKTHSNERLGLTVCYSAGEEYGETTDGGGGAGGSGGSGNEVYAAAVGATEVYISDIHADSVAGRDGRLRQGDQILQINGKDITNKEETETLIAENNNAVTLLVSRYLYGEDDFNDPSTNDDDDEVLVVEDDEDDEEDDEEEEEEEFYDENNMTYVNCMISKECCLNTVEDFDKAIMSQVVEQQHKGQSVQQCIQSNDETPELTMANLGSCQKVVVAGGTTKISKSDKRLMATATRKVTNPKMESNAASNLTVAAVVSSGNAENKTSEYYESEHIYETIPEDPESEPFYCSPYDSSVYVTAIASCSSSTGTTDALQQQMPNKQRVVQWLGINSTQGSSGLHRHSMRSSVAGNCNRSLKYRHKTNTSSTGRSTMTSITNGSGIDAIGSAMTLPASAHADDHENSSSAYNTGGSNNSVSPHALVLNQKGRNDGAFNQVSGSIALTSTNSSDDVLAMQHLLMQHKIVAQQKMLSPKDKNKITSPKSNNNKLPLMMDMQQTQISGGGGGSINNASKPLMYNNSDSSNIIQRNMLHLLKQPLTAVEKNQAQSPYYQPHQPLQEQMHCPPQFTAPNLSQYHFVSSQEVNNLSLNNKMPKSSPTIAENTNASSNTAGNNADDEDTMVWKVKRRPDGTRYIVRRPAKSRNIKERSSMRMNMERLRDDNNTTTEDDNMSEVKTGRYWTREERKKHIEKAKERRQQQQQQQQIQYQQQQQQQQQQHQQQQLMQQQQQQKQTETANELQQEREKMRQGANFLSFSRQKYRQHYQLQFNSAEAQKHKQTLNYLNNTTMTSMGCEDNGGGGAGGTAMLNNMEQNDVHATAAATTAAASSSAQHLGSTTVEHNTMSSSTMISVTTV